MIVRVIMFSCLLIALVTAQSQDLSIYRSSSSVQETERQLVYQIAKENLTYFETVSHDSIAYIRGTTIDPTRVVLFEDPDLTTQLITCQQTTALDLPMRILIWEENEDVYIGFIDPDDLKKRFMLTGCDETIESMTKLMVRLVNDVIRAQQ